MSSPVKAGTTAERHKSELWVLMNLLGVLLRSASGESFFLLTKALRACRQSRNCTGLAQNPASICSFSDLPLIQDLPRTVLPKSVGLVVEGGWMQYKSKPGSNHHPLQYSDVRLFRKTPRFGFSRRPYLFIALIKRANHLISSSIGSSAVKHRVGRILNA